MKNLQKVSGNELSELLQAISICIDTLKKDFLHVSDFLQKEINLLEAKRQQIRSEYERREDQL